MIRVVKVHKLRGADRDSVCYCGRAFAGWPMSKWHNPYKVRTGELQIILDVFKNWMIGQPESYLSELWEACEYGSKPLGCWCIDAVHGDGQEVVCHAQLLAAELAKRYSS